MVTRVDKKPIIYNTTCIRAWRPAVANSRITLLNELKVKSVGHRVPKVDTVTLIDDFDDIDYAFRMFGIDDRYNDYFADLDDEESDECVRMARTMIDRTDSLRMHARHEDLMNEVCKAQAELIKDVERIYYGTEAVYQLWAKILYDKVFESRGTAHYENWSKRVAEEIIQLQAPYMFLHPIGAHVSSREISRDINFNVWGMWHKFKKAETLVLRIGSRKNALAHAFFSGFRAGDYEPHKNRLDDFRMPATGYARTASHVEYYAMMGIKYIKVGDDLMILSPDDCVNLATMAQAHFRTCLYFAPSNGYKDATFSLALGILKDITLKCCKLIDTGKNFSSLIRSMHIMAQREFNDKWEELRGDDLGWRARSENYLAEAQELDPTVLYIHDRIMGLARNDLDKLNVGFIYHAFVGDEMLLEDLREKLEKMPSKVLDCNEDEWKAFLSFSKAYFLARFCFVYKRKPKVAGDIGLMNGKWATSCIEGKFVMPPSHEWGHVWISNEFTWTNFANTWHLEAQDVAYVMKDSEGLCDGQYRGINTIGSELLMAMTSGEILDTLTGSTANSARARIRKNKPVREVVLTSAPKAENAKPSWKKRVTFAADNEFRKMQAEYDRNCRKVMTFVRGPSLAVDQHILESQFRNISDATTMGINGAICSHDISAWSESMDRDRKFQFENILTAMLASGGMHNIKSDWGKIKGLILKQGAKDVYKLNNGSFQGFDGSSSTILHSMILLYCMETARRGGIISKEVRTDMATLIDDCVAFMQNLTKQADAINFWNHLKTMYRKLGFEVDELKSIFSTIKAIYLSRRFLLGGEVPSDMKVFIKAHTSYEDPLRCATDIIPDVFGATRGACDANGDVWFIYHTSIVTALAELAHQVPSIVNLDPVATAVLALAPSTENGWGIPSLVDWCTNDIMDKRTHFNALMEAAANHDQIAEKYKAGITVVSKPTMRMYTAIKNQTWRIVSAANIFTNPFEAIRDGPLKPDMLRRNAVTDLLKEVISAEPWKSLMSWNTSDTTLVIRQALIASGPLHAPTLSAMVNCMPDNYRLGMVGKAVGSNSLLNILPRGMKVVLKRRVIRCARQFYEYGASIYNSTHETLEAEDLLVMTHLEQTVLERDQFYEVNGVKMIDHTFPDPVGSFCHTSEPLGVAIGPNLSGLRMYDMRVDLDTARDVRDWVSTGGAFVPARSGRVWEVTSEYARGWDSVSQRIAMGLAILARAKADGHKVAGLLSYFVKAWNEEADITPEDTNLIAIHGSIKRLDSNPGSSGHPITCHRNILSGLEVKLKHALDAIELRAKEITGETSHLHDVLAHMTALRAVTALQTAIFIRAGKANFTHKYNLGLRPDCVMPASLLRMDTDKVKSYIDEWIMDAESAYGLLQAAPALSSSIVIPTMKTGWVEMINALMDGNHGKCNELMANARECDPDVVIEDFRSRDAVYSTNVVVAQAPAARHTFIPDANTRYTIIPAGVDPRTIGDAYTMPVRGIGTRLPRALTDIQPEHVVAAVAIKSVIWVRIRHLDMTKLSEILYDDPDADLSILNGCKRNDFWRGVVTEVHKAKKVKALSELMVSGFRSFGIHGLRLAVSNSINDVTQSIASYFGANLKEVPKIIANDLLHITGRSARNFETPILEKIVTNNPALTNNKMRKDHLGKILKHNIATYEKRIKDLEENIKGGLIPHRGDNRSHDRRYRLAELRNRKAVYCATSVDGNGRASISYSDIFNYIARAGMALADKHGYNMSVPTTDDMDEDDIVDQETCYMITDHIAEVASECAAEKKDDHGWSAGAGKKGIEYAVNMITADSDRVFETQFAISASEIAPRLAKRAITAAVIDVHTVGTVTAGAVEEDDDGLIGFEEMVALGTFSEGFSDAPRKVKLPFAAWKMLFTVIFCKYYAATEVNEKLGTTIPFDPTILDLRSTYLNEFSDDDILKVYPTIFGDYISCNVAFEDEWVDGDGTDAYTVEELGVGAGGWFF